MYCCILFAAGAIVLVTVKITNNAGRPGDSMAEQAGEAAAIDGISALMSAREKRTLDVAAVRDVLLAKLEALPLIVKPKHASDFYRVVREKEHSQQTKSECIACGHSFATTGSTRLVKHLLFCALVPREVKQPFLELQEKSESVQAGKRQHEILVKEEAQQQAAEHSAKQAKLKQQNVRVGLKSLEVAEADMAIAKFFYANGLAFSAASTDQESYYREMVKKIQAAPIGYVPPNRHKLAGPLLDETNKWM